MLMTFRETVKLISDGKVLHISGTEALLRMLPKGNWIGGSTEYFMAEDGGEVSGEQFFVTEFDASEFSILSYSDTDIQNVAIDAYSNGFSIVIVPFDSKAHREYAENAATFEDMFMKNVVGWVSGRNLDIPSQTPITVDGRTNSVYQNKAVALHLKVSDKKTVLVNMINIFSQDEDSPVITFEEEGFSIKKCLVDGKERILSEYIAENNIDTKLPLVGNYSGNGVNISVKSIDGDTVNFYAPVFSGIEYRFAAKISDYAAEFNNRLAALKNVEAAFSCNCILNFLYGELEGKKIESFYGPITFGEIAYQLVNQTLVYVTVVE